jgi:hypothetical protein
MGAFASFLSAPDRLPMWAIRWSTVRKQFQSLAALSSQCPGWMLGECLHYAYIRKFSSRKFPGDGEALPSLIRAGQLISGQHVLPSRHCGHVVQYEDELDKN